MKIEHDYRSFKAFKKLYSLTNTALITPGNLLSNIELPNYESIKYIKIDNTLSVEIFCRVENEKRAIFLYEFDSKRFLQRILAKVDGDECSIIFDRASSLVSAKRQFTQSLREKVV